MELLLGEHAIVTGSRSNWEGSETPRTSHLQSRQEAGATLTDRDTYVTMYVAPPPPGLYSWSRLHVLVFYDLWVFAGVKGV